MVTEGEALQAMAALDALAERLCASGQLQDSAVALLGRQAVRALWTELHPRPPEPKSEPG